MKSDTKRAFTRRLPLAFAASVLALTGCAAELPDGTQPDGTSVSDLFPVTIESCGIETTYDEAPTRVILGHYETLPTLEALGVADAVHGYLLGAGDLGVAPDDLPSNLVLVSPVSPPAREVVIAEEPDLFLANNEAQLNTEGKLSYEDLAGTGSNAYVIGGYCASGAENGDIEYLYSEITALGDIFGVPERANALNEELRKRVETASAGFDRENIRVAFIRVSEGKLYAVGGYPAAMLISTLGMTNEFAGMSTPAAELSIEQALVMEPDYVFLQHAGEDEDALVAAFAELLPSSQALQNGGVIPINLSPLQGGGVNIVDAIDQLAALIQANDRPGQ